MTRKLDLVHRDIALVQGDIVACRGCSRLVAWREKVAREKRAAYRDETYWGRPVPGFGDPNARIVIVGLAPAAHGANRTGRVFTGDRSGDFLYAALFRAGLASQPVARGRDDGLELEDVFVTCPVRCAPPDNRPLPDEISRCAPFFDRELACLGQARVFLALGAIGWRACLDHFARVHGARPAAAATASFAHGRAITLERGHAPSRSSSRATPGAPRRDGALRLLASYHVSQQNTQTGRLTPAMFDRVLATAKRLAERDGD